MLNGTKFEVGKQYKCSNGLLVECLAAWDGDTYYRMVGRVLECRYAGWNVGDDYMFSGEHWKEYTPPPPPETVYLMPREISHMHLYRSLKGVSQEMYPIIFKVEYTKGDDLPKVTRVK